MSSLEGPGPRRNGAFPVAGGWWVASGDPRIEGLVPDPADWETWGKPTHARLIVGLGTARKAAWRKGAKIPPRFLRGLVFDVRTLQVGTDYGGSFVSQIGHFVPKGAKAVGREIGRLGESMQILLYPADGEEWRGFRAHVDELAAALVEDLGQKRIIGEFTRKGRVVGMGEWKWCGQGRSAAHPGGC